MTDTTEAPAPERPPIRRLIRRPDHKMVAGVAAGLGDYFGVDPVWFRVGFVVAAFAAGTGLVAYIALWILMPEPDEAANPPSTFEQHAERLADSVRGTPAWVGVAFVVLGALVVTYQIVEWRAGLFWGVGLVVLGVLLFRHHDDQIVRAPRTLRPAPIQAPLEPGPAAPTSPPFIPTAPLPAGAPPPPPRVRERSRLGWFTFGALLVVLGGAGALDLADAVDVYLAQYLALALAMIGLALVAGAWFGRARWLIVPGILLIPFVLTASLIRVPLTGGWGDRYVLPRSASSLLPEYHIAAGQLTLDLRRTDLSDEPHDIVVTAAFGSIRVLLPEDLPVLVSARVGAGAIQLFGQFFDGVDLDVTRTLGGAEPLIRLDLEASLGHVDVSS